MTDGETAAGRVGQLVDDRYKLVEVMAAGAMGEVYKAERVPVGKIVAIKFLHASMVSDSEFQARFDRETRVMSKLAHPNCVSVVDFGVWRDTPYLVMDFVNGTTLRKRLDDDGAQTPEKALALARQITAGLAHAHEQGIIHRDIKPANIMISDEIGHGERVRILDFGLARLRGNGGGEANRGDATQTNMVVGTPNYMAPEQTVPGGTIDARTDLYACGVVLFEMVVGERPFAAEDTMALLGMHRAAPIPRLADRVAEGTELPEGLQAVIDKAMAKSPDARYQTAIEFADAIDALGKTAIVIEPQKKVDSGLARRIPNSTAIGSASTLVASRGSTRGSAESSDIDATTPDPPRPSTPMMMAPRRSRFWPTILGLALVVGGVSAMAGYLITHRGDHNPAVTPPPVSHDAAVIVATITPDAAALEPDAGIGSGSDAEIEMDPETAEDLDPAKGSAETAEDEDANAPKNNEEAETKAAPSPPQLATTVHDAVLLIQGGHREEAIASLRGLEKKQPKSAYIPFLLGNLYFDKTWWSVSMDNYAQAIHINPAYKANGVISKNLLKMLASGKTRTRAFNFLRGMGHPALPYVKYAAAHDPNPIIKKTATGLQKQIR